MRHFNYVRIHQQAGETFATVGGGCQIKHLLMVLNRRGLTTPSVGLITEQTIAGAISTGTHGRGRPRPSHYISALRIACFPADVDVAQIREVTEGTELRAARCSLGCLGVIVDVTLRCVPEYFVRERFSPCNSIEEVLAREADAALAAVLPHPAPLAILRTGTRSLRQESGEPRGTSLPSVLVLHDRCRTSSPPHALCRGAPQQTACPLPVSAPDAGGDFTRWVVTDRSDKMLVMEHELFRHLEMELFVPATHLVAAAEYVVEVLQVADGSRTEVSTIIQEQLRSAGLLEALTAIKGTFSHHYPVCFRRVLADDTLISMSTAVRFAGTRLVSLRTCSHVRRSMTWHVSWRQAWRSSTTPGCIGASGFRWEPSKYARCILRYANSRRSARGSIHAACSEMGIWLLVLGLPARTEAAKRSQAVAMRGSTVERADTEAKP